jgi:hypothetical protein
MRVLTRSLLLTTLGSLALLSSPALGGDVAVQLPAGDGFVVKDNTGAVERYRVDEATGNVSRNGALFVHTTGSDNTFVGVGAGNTGTTGGGRNSAFGQDALSSVASGGENSAFGNDALAANTIGLKNTAVGSGALRANTAGHFSSAFGADALADATGSYNSAFGHAALNRNTTGSLNAAVGGTSLFYNTTGYSNVALGVQALQSNTTGNRNVAIGRRAGFEQTTGDDNIYLANEGVAGESDQIKIGTAGTHTDTSLVGDVTTPGRLAVGTDTIDPTREFTLNDHDDNGGASMKIATSSPASRELVIGVNQGSGSFISMNSSAPLDFRTNGTRRLRIQADGTIDSSGIAGNTSPGVSVVNVLLNTTTNELGIVVSSARFKQDVRDMGAASEPLMALRPVTFRYREDVAAGEDGSQYGLIAEEVAEVAPELVIYDNEGRPFTVRYHQLAPMLINELQKQERRDREQQRTIEALRSRLQELERQVSGEATAVEW